MWSGDLFELHFIFAYNKLLRAKLVVKLNAVMCKHHGVEADNILGECPEAEIEQITIAFSVRHYATTTPKINPLLNIQFHSEIASFIKKSHINFVVYTKKMTFYKVHYKMQWMRKTSKENTKKRLKHCQSKLEHICYH